MENFFQIAMNKPSLPQLRQAIGDETRSALIDAASGVFIEEGFRAARVQAIAERAGTRLSAINYHFGGKDGLYRAVLQHHAELAISQTPMPEPDLSNPRASLEAGVRTIARRFLDPEGNSRIGTLLLRELMNPTDALTMMIERFARPQSQRFRSLVAAALGPLADEETVSRATLSIMSQCIGYVTMRPLIEHIAPETLAGNELVERIAAQVSTFSWGGLMALRETLEEKQ